MSTGPRSPLGAAVFSLETDDRTDEERARGRDTGKDRMASALGMGSSDPPRAPMDTGGQYPEDIERAKPTIKFNLNFDSGDRKRLFDIETLFEAACSGDVMKLDGLHQYLKKSMKKLTNSEYQSRGKNALQKALLNLRDGENKVVEFLLDISERMGDVKEFVNAPFTDSDYKGQTALHIAIERRSQYYVELLVKKGADVHAKACGKFFQPQDGPSFYFGELPLSLAACTNQQSVVDFLLENQRADVRQTDSWGNTVLHALVAVADNSEENTAFVTAMYDHVLTSTARLHPPKWRLEDIENRQGLTPLKMAAKTGKIGIFGHILRREFKESNTKHLSRKFTEWVYGPVHSSLYDLASLDSYKDSNSVLEILVYGSDIPNRHQMLQLEPLSRLLEEKWDRFAARIFLFNFLVYVLYLVVFTMVAYNKKEKPPFSIQHTTDGYLYLSGQLLMALASCYFFIRGIVDMSRKRPKLQTLLIDGYSEILFFVQSLLFLACAVLYCFGRQEYLGFLVLCLALSWINLLYFSRGNRHMGIYSVMIQKMILSDILRFLFVYLVFLFGFSAAVVTLLIDPAGTTNGSTAAIPDAAATNSSNGGRSLFGGVPPEEKEGCLKPTYRNISYTTLELFKFTIGMGDLEFTERYEYKEVFYVLLISYIILTYILLLNMLIALMGRTVEQITAESMGIWKLQRAITILDLEKGLPRCLRDKFRSGVEKDLSATAGGDRDRRRCFRVEEFNWNIWNRNLGIINDEPGDRERAVPSPVHSPAECRGRNWRGFFREASRYTRQRHHGQQTQQQTTEIIPLSSSHQINLGVLDMEKA